MIRFLWDNEWDGGAVTVNDENANFPATNTQHRWWQKTWRSTGTGTAYLEIDLGSAIAITVVALKYNNFTAAAAIDLYGDSDDAFSPPEYSQELDPINQDIMIEYFASPPVALQYWELVIVDAAVPEGYHTIGRVFLGTYWSPSRNFTTGGGRQGLVDTSSIVSGELGHISAVLKEKILSFRYAFERIPASDLATFISMYETLGESKAFFITEDSDNPATTTYYVRFAGPLQITPEYNSRFTVTINLVETM